MRYIRYWRILRDILINRWMEGQRNIILPYRKSTTKAYTSLMTMTNFNGVSLLDKISALARLSIMPES